MVPARRRRARLITDECLHVAFGNESASDGGGVAVGAHVRALLTEVGFALLKRRYEQVLAVSFLPRCLRQ